jgi:hypothetical protein
MKHSLIWTAIGAVVIGAGVPAYAAVQTSKPLPTVTTVRQAPEDTRGNCDEAEHATDPGCIAVSPVAAPQAVLVAQSAPTVAAATPASIDDNSTGNSVDDSTRNSVGDDSTSNSVDDSTSNSVDDSTRNSVDDISGPCDEAEHATDPRCAGSAPVNAPANSTPANSTPDNSIPGNDDSGHHGGGDDSGHHSNDG